MICCFFFFSSRRRHTRYWRDWSSDVCSSDLVDGLDASAVHDDFPAPPLRLHRCSARQIARSEEHTSELQSRQYLVCRLLLEKKNKRSTTRLMRQMTSFVPATPSPMPPLQYTP